jgi:hypothetical protein
MAVRQILCQLQKKGTERSSSEITHTNSIIQHRSRIMSQVRVKKDPKTLQMRNPHPLRTT